MWPKQASWTQTQILAVLLIVTGALAGRLAITEPGTSWYWPPAIILGYLFSAIVFEAWDRRTSWFSRSSSGATRLTTAGLLVGMLLLGIPFAEGAARILSAAYFRPLEQVTLVALTNFAFFAVAVPRVQRAGAAAVWVSFVLLISALMLGEHEAIVPLTAAYGGLSVVWLATSYWRSVIAAVSKDAPVRVPLVPVVCLTVLLAGITAASTRFARGMPDIWGEWAPSSGGSQWANPAALLGIGDGDWVVSGPNAKSTGSIDSEYFLESDVPSMYDVMTESYGEPRRPDELLRAIFVRQEQMLSQPGHKAPDAGSAGRQFSLYRKGRSQQRTPKSEDANALLYVEGRTPLHLATTVFERFDGVSWHEPQESRAACRLETHEPDTAWMWLPKRPLTEIPGGTRLHKVRLGRFSCDSLPLPNYLERLRLGHQDGERIKRWANAVLVWAHDGILRARQCLPTGTILEVESHSLCRSKLFQSDELVGSGPPGDPYLAVPDHLHLSAVELANHFSQMPRGWAQVQAVLDHLQTHCAHDRDRTIPPTCEDPIHYFLHQARGGPAYQFVTAATLALRSLGYPTRVVSGFYVAPTSYVARAGHTPVHADDAHFWIEVRTVHGDWITFDPTPGYLTEWYRPTFLEWAGQLAATLAHGLFARPLITLAGVFMSFALWWRRRWVRERVLTLWCLWWPLRSPERRLVDTLRLLDIRSGLCGHQRPLASTPLAWYGGVDHPACRDYMQCLYAVLYGDARHARSTEDSAVERTCRAVVRAMAPRDLRERLSPA